MAKSCQQISRQEAKGVVDYMGWTTLISSRSQCAVEKRYLLLALAQYCWLGMMIVVNTYLDPARYVAIENAHETSLGRSAREALNLAFPATT